MINAADNKIPTANELAGYSNRKQFKQDTINYVIDILVSATETEDSKLIELLIKQARDYLFQAQD